MASNSPHPPSSLLLPPHSSRFWSSRAEWLHRVDPHLFAVILSSRLVSWVISWAVDLHQLHLSSDTVDTQLQLFFFCLTSMSQRYAASWANSTPRGNEATDDPHPRPWRSGSPNHHHPKIYQDTPKLYPIHLILSIPCLLDRPASLPTTRCQGAAQFFLFLKADWRQLLAKEVLPDCGSPKISTMRPLGNPPCLRSKDGEAPWPSNYLRKKADLQHVSKSKTQLQVQAQVPSAEEIPWMFPRLALIDFKLHPASQSKKRHIGPSDILNKSPDTLIPHSCKGRISPLWFACCPGSSCWASQTVVGTFVSGLSKFSKLSRQWLQQTPRNCAGHHGSGAFVVPPGGAVVESLAPMERQNFHGWAASQAATPRSRGDNNSRLSSTGQKQHLSNAIIRLSALGQGMEVFFANVVWLNGILTY